MQVADAGVRVLRGPDRPLRRGQDQHRHPRAPVRHRRLRRHPRLPRRRRRDDQHLPPARPLRARLLNSAKLLRAELPYDRDSLAATIVELIERNAPTGDVYIRPFVYKPAVQLTPRLRGIGDELAIYMLSLGDYLDTSSAVKGDRLLLVPRSRTTRSPAAASSPAPTSTPRSPRTRPRRRAPTRRSCSTPHGHVAEGSGCNLFIVRDGILITPPITGDILEGITRRSFLQFAQDAGIPTEQREIDRTELYIADEAFFCGTGVQVAPIASDRRPPDRRRQPRPDHRPPARRSSSTPSAAAPTATPTG